MKKTRLEALNQEVDQHMEDVFGVFFKKIFIYIAIIFHALHVQCMYVLLLLYWFRDAFLP